MTGSSNKMMMMLKPLGIGTLVGFAAVGAAFAASNVTSIDFKADGAASRIEIKSNGPVEVLKQENAEDRQIVLDLKNAKLTKYATRKLDTSSFDSPVSLISPYQLKDQPDTARVVIQLRQMTSADVAQEGNTIRVSLGAAPEEPPASGEAVVGDAELSPPPVSAGGPGADVAVAAPPAPPAEAGGGETPAAAAAPAGPKSQLQQFIESRETRRFIGRPITLQLRDADLADVFRLIGEASGFNIVLGDDVKGKATVSLVEVPWDQALDVILSNHRLGAERNNNVLRIVTLVNLTKEKEEQLKAKQASEASSPRITRIFPISFARLAELQGIISKFASQNTSTVLDATTIVQPDVRTNSLIVRDTPDNIERIKKLIEVLDTQTPQILIEAKVVEASEQFSRNINGTLAWSSADNPPYIASFNAGNPASAGIPLAPDRGSIGASFGILPGGARIHATIQMGESEGTAKVLSAPKTVVLDKERATISAGEPVLFTSTTSTGSSTTITQTTQTADLTLTVSPTVTNEGSVLLDLTVNRGVIRDMGSGQNAIAPRTITTKVLVDSGSTLVMGGVYTLDQNESSSGFPVLRKIPIIGWLFGQETSVSNKSELMFFITPKILNPKEAGLQS